jgi:hypothetical protein
MLRRFLLIAMLIFQFGQQNLVVCATRVDQKIDMAFIKKLDKKTNIMVWLFYLNDKGMDCRTGNKVLTPETFK